MVAWRRCALALLLLAASQAGTTGAFASGAIELAQAQTPAQPQPPQATPAPSPAPSPSPTPAAPAADVQAAPEEPIGNVASVTGIATVIRQKNSYPLKVRDDIYLNDIVQTSSNSSLGITFNDATTFNLSASARITIDNYVYEDGGKQNAGLFDVAKGTVAFVAAAVAKTGDMKITTPTATLGIRGTTGVIEVPADGRAAAAAANNINIKLYPDADGRVGHIDIDDRTSGTRLGALTQAASGFAIRPGTGAMRLAAVPLTISPQQVQRDRAFVQQVHTAQTAGRQIVTEQRAFRRANPGVINPNAPRRSGQPGQAPQGPRPNATPGQQQPRQPGQNNRPGQKQPGAPNRQEPGRQGAQPSQRQGQGAPGAGSGQQRQQRPGQQRQGQPQQGQGQQPGTPRGDQNARPDGAANPQSPRREQNPAPQPGAPPQQQTPPATRQQGQPAQPPAAQPRPGRAQRPPGAQQRPQAPQRAAPRKPAPNEKERR
jgi:hypothetical protein